MMESENAAQAEGASATSSPKLERVPWHHWRWWLGYRWRTRYSWYGHNNKVGDYRTEAERAREVLAEKFDERPIPQQQAPQGQRSPNYIGAHGESR